MTNGDDQLRDPARIPPIRLNRHRLGRVAYVPHLQHPHRKPRAAHPRRAIATAASLQSNLYQLDLELVKPADQRLGLIVGAIWLATLAFMLLFDQAKMATLNRIRID